MIDTGFGNEEKAMNEEEQRDTRIEDVELVSELMKKKPRDLVEMILNERLSVIYWQKKFLQCERSCEMKESELTKLRVFKQQMINLKQTATNCNGGASCSLLSEINLW